MFFYWVSCQISQHFKLLIPEYNRQKVNGMVADIQVSCIAKSSVLTVKEIDGLAQERRNSIANALELRLSCTNPSKWFLIIHK